MKQTLAFSGRVRPEDILPQRCIYLPLTVPPGTERIDVSLDHSDRVLTFLAPRAGNAVDIAIFDPRGLSFLEGHGFRGWGGSVRRQFFLSPGEATAGFTGGPIPAGQWHIFLGFEHILEQGCRYDVQVELTVAQEGVKGQEAGAIKVQAAASNPDPRPLGRPDGGWYRGDLHCHTIHSDGLNTVEEIARAALDRGLDFLAITDHNVNTHHQELAPLSHLDILLVPGQEITTYRGHANVWGLRDWIDFRCTDSEAAQAVARWVLDRGGLISVNHPKAVGPAWLFDQGDGYPCMEVWQAPWNWFNWESLERWDRVLQQGRRIVAVGGSDVHSIPPARQMHPHGLGEPATWVYVPGPLTEGTLLEAIRQGHVFISEHANGPHLHLTADADGDGHYETMMGDAIEARDGQRLAFRIRCLGATHARLWLVSDGTILDILEVDGDDFLHDFSLDVSGRTYLRAELRDFRGPPDPPQVVLAMTNPIYLAAAG